MLNKKELIEGSYCIDCSGNVYNPKGILLSMDYNEFKRGKKNARVLFKTYHQNKRKTHILHVEVMKAFNKVYDSDTDLIDFKDGNHMNCSYDNLVLKKNACIRKFPYQEVNSFFEKQDPYKIVYSFIKTRVRSFNYTDSFTYEDLVQHLITLLHRRTYSYMLNGIDKGSYFSFAFNLFDNLLKYGDLFKVFRNQSSVIEINNTFDDIYAISEREYFKTNHDAEYSIR